MRFDEAVSSIVNTVLSVWDSSYPMEYQNKPLVTAPSSDQIWGKLNIQHTASSSVSFGDGSHRRLYERNGFVEVHVFTPTGEGRGAGDQICMQMLDAFEGNVPTGGIWFKKTFIREVGQIDAHYQTDLVTFFEYRDFK